MNRPRITKDYNRIMTNTQTIMSNHIECELDALSWVRFS